MKNFRSFIRISAFLLFCWITVFTQNDKPFSIDEAPIPNNGQPINDFANIIDDTVEQQLNQKIKDFKARTNPQVVLVVATVKTTGDRPIADYAIALYRGWKVGTSDGDNPGALLLVAVDDRKYFTEVGRDLEDELPDGLAGQLQRQYLVPAFKQNNYTKGISDTIDAYIKTIEARQQGQEPPPVGETQPTTKKKTGSVSITGIVCCLGIGIIILIIIFSRSGSSGGRGGRGGGGFGGGALPWIIGSIIANSGSSGGSSSNWGGGGSGDFGGGGGSDWGGFGGGGDAGGGGAGGDW